MQTLSLTKSKLKLKTFSEKESIISPYFRNTGIHKKELCVYEKGKEQDFAEQNPALKKEENPRDFSAFQIKINNLLKEVKELQEKVKLERLKEERKKEEEIKREKELEEKAELEREEEQERAKEKEKEQEKQGSLRAEHGNSEEKELEKKPKVFSPTPQNQQVKTFGVVGNGISKVVNGGVGVAEKIADGFVIAHDYLAVKKNNLCLWSGWCDGIEEENNKLDITEYVHSNEGEMVGILSRRDFGFQIAQNSKVNKEKSNNQETYVIIHGFRSNPQAWAENMAQNILQKNTNAQILLLDWSDITQQAWIDIVPDNESTWIKVVSDKLKTKLVDWKINPNNTTIIGHSLGTLLGSELANKTGIEKRIFLDPASGADYKTDLNNTSFKKQGGFKGKGICFIGSGSWSGSESLANTCKETYLIDFPFTSLEHSNVHKLYSSIISSNTLYKNLLSPYQSITIPQHDKLQEVDENGKIIFIDGYLDVVGLISKNKLNYLELENNNRKQFYGSTIDNNFKCKETICEFYGWYGEDKYKQSIIDFDNNFIVIKDFKIFNNDKLFLKSKPFDIKENNKTTSFKVKSFFGVDRYILEGVSLGEVEGWLDVAKYPENYTDKIKNNNPIKLE